MIRDVAQGLGAILLIAACGLLGWVLLGGEVPTLLMKIFGAGVGVSCSFLLLVILARSP